MGKISQFIQFIRDGIFTDIPPEYQTCESCRNEPACTSGKAATCKYRLEGELQELRHRNEERKPK